MEQALPAPWFGWYWLDGVGSSLLLREKGAHSGEGVLSRIAFVSITMRIISSWHRAFFPDDPFHAVLTASSAMLRPSQISSGSSVLSLIARSISIPPWDCKPSHFSFSQFSLNKIHFNLADLFSAADRDLQQLYPPDIDPL